MTIRTPSARFPTTAWSCVEKAADRYHPDFVAAMNRLISSYWKPVYHFLRAKGHGIDSAEDLVQEFFLRFLVRDWLKPADRNRGRFRNLLLTILKRFVHDETVGAKAQPKFEAQFVSVHDLLRDEDRAWEPPAGETAEQMFDKQWKADTWETARASLKGYYEALGRLAEYEVFAAYRFGDRFEEKSTQEQLAARFKLTRDKVRGVLEKLKKHFARLLRQELRDQGCPEDELENEIRNLM